MNKDLIGRLVVSKAGHDKGRVLCVVDCNGEYLLLADGRKRMAEKPKRKKLKHVELINVAAYSGSVRNKAIHAYIRDAVKLVETAND